MGQYFKLVNVSKKEWINPYCCNDLAKFCEVITGNVGNLFLYLMRKSDGSGGGDIPTIQDSKYSIKHTLETIAKAKEENNQKDIEWHTPYLARYRKQLAYAKKIKFAGRWVGDYVILVGDYDSSKWYSKAVDEFENITHLVMEEYNEFVGEEYGIYCEESHNCYVYKRKAWIKQHYHDRIENVRDMIKGNRYSPVESAYKEIEEAEDAIELFKAEDEYYGKWIEPKLKLQIHPSGRVEHKGKLAPDMIISATKRSDE